MGGMRGRESTVKNSPCVGPDALIALVRLLARQAARECALPARAPPDTGPNPQGGK
jgi:hypothetical protein